MEKIISVNLAGRVLPIEEDAFVLLNHYFESLRTYFANTEGAEEIVGDIESRVSEMLSDELRAGAPAVNVLHVSGVKARMGSTEDFRAADGGSPAPEEEEQYAFTKPPLAGKGRSKFARNSEDKMLGGVCSGIAAYFQIDPALVRVLFAVLTLGGWGTGILLYGVIWAFTPEEALPAVLTGRRLYRDGNSRLGGVCAGLGAYFDKDPWLFRVIFLLPFLGILGSSNWGGGWGILGGSFSFTIVVIYFLLWALLPEAKTPLQREEMRGEHSDINRIREQVRNRTQSFKKEVRDRTQSFEADVRESANRFSTAAGERWKATNFKGAPAVHNGAQVLGKVARGLVLFISGLIAFCFLVLLLGYFFGGFSDAVNGFLLQTPQQRVLLSLALILLLGTPVISLLVKISSSALRLPMSRFWTLGFSVLWISGLVLLFVVTPQILQGFRYRQKVVTRVPLPQPAGKLLTVAVPGEGFKYNNSFSGLHVSGTEARGWDFNPDALSLGNIWIGTEASPDSLFHVLLTRESRGRSRAQATRLAQNINYPLSLTGSQLSLPAGYIVTRATGFRGQAVQLRIQVPAGSQVQFHPSMRQKLIVGNEDYTRLRMRINNEELFEDVDETEE